MLVLSCSKRTFESVLFGAAPERAAPLILKTTLRHLGAAVDLGFMLFI